MDSSYRTVDDFLCILHEEAKRKFSSSFRSPSLEKQILKSSDQYLFKKNISLWEQDWFKNAYLTYFLFTQSSRLHYVFSKMKSHIFNAHENIVDFGCGPGTAQKVYESLFSNHAPTQSWINVDRSKEALKLAQLWNKNTKYRTEFIQSHKIPKAQSNNDLLIAAYSLCELEESNSLTFNRLIGYKTLIIIEPGQKKESKKLIELRNKLIGDEGYYAYAPCPHQSLCPMTHEKKHWCHDHIEKPSFLNRFKLPFSQNKLNLSYLLLSKTAPDQKTSKQRQNFGRIVGDQRLEKGKTRVSVCFDGELSSLSWLKKTKLSIDINRGDLIRWMDDFEKKGQEIRIFAPLQKVDEEHCDDDSGSTLPIS